MSSKSSSSPASSIVSDSDENTRRSNQTAPAFEIKSERIKNLGRLERAAAFSIFRDLHLVEPTNRQMIRSDYKVYDLNNRVIFYVSSTSSIPITKDAPFCLRIMNKDQKQVAKFLRNEPRAKPMKNRLFSRTGCCTSKRDEMEIMDDVGNMIAKSTVFNDAFHGTEIVIKDPQGKTIIVVKGTKDTKDVFYVVGPKNRFFGEIRQKIIASGNSLDNYKGVSAWFSPDVSIDIKLLFLAAAFLIEIDHFSESASRVVPFHQPDTDYLVPIIQTPPYHQKVQKMNKSRSKKTKKNGSLRESDKMSMSSSKTTDSKTEKSKFVMPEIHHIKNFAPIGGDVENPSKLEKADNDSKSSDILNKEEVEMAGLNREQFRSAGRKVLDYLVKQDEGLKTSRCTPAVNPGYLKALIPSKPPAKAEDIDEILEDYHKLILPGLSHSGHPNYHSYFPSGNAFHCILADLLSGHIGDSGFSWTSNPAMTELEVLMMDWLGEMMGLPKELLIFPEGSRGGGCMQRSASESNFLVMVAARTEMIKRVKRLYSVENTANILSRMVVYTSEHGHASIKNAAASALVKVRVLPADDSYSLRGDTVYNAVITDRQKGLIPFFVSATFGTTGPCSFDNLHELGPVCRENGIWLHVDAAYAGSALICPEMRVLMRGIEWADSFSTSPCKLAIPVCDVCCLWVRDRFKLQTASIQTQPDLPYKGLPRNKKFGALKLWFIVRTYGVENLQKQIREHVRLGQFIESKLRNDGRFEVCNRVVLGLVCFRVRADDNFNKALLYRLNETGKISLASCTLDKRFTIRLVVNTPKSSEEDLEEAYNLISNEVNVLKPFQDTIDLMNPDEFEEFIKNQTRPKDKKHEKKDDLNVTHPSMSQHSEVLVSGSSLSGTAPTSPSTRVASTERVRTFSTQMSKVSSSG